MKFVNYNKYVVHRKTFDFYRMRTYRQPTVVLVRNGIPSPLTPKNKKRGLYMAIYHLSIKNVSRAKGTSSCANLSYITASKVTDENTGETYYGFGHSDRIQQTGIELPKHAPAEFEDAGVCFSSLEKYEKSSNARTAKKITVALPREVSTAEREEMIKAFTSLFTTKGYPVAWAIHEDKEGNNPHAHLLVANRSIDSKGQWQSRKSKKVYVLDEGGNRVPILDKNTGKQKVDSHNRLQWKRTTVQANWLDEKESLRAIRENWEHVCNEHLEEEEKVSCKSLEAQGSDRVPTIHEGWQARSLEAQGIASERCEMNREIKEHNKLLEQLKNALKETIAMAQKFMNQKRGDLNARIGQLFAGRDAEPTTARTTGAVAGRDAGREQQSESRSIEAQIRERDAQRRESEAQSKDYHDAKLREEARRAEAEREEHERFERKYRQQTRIHESSRGMHM